jgi:branched-chain amino acid transport system substrate-binding protein
VARPGEGAVQSPGRQGSGTGTHGSSIAGSASRADVIRPGESSSRSSGGSALAGNPVSNPGGAPAVPGSGGPAQATTSKRSPVVVASVGTLSGPGGAVLMPIVQGAQVWARWINQAGGLNGHPVQVLTYDDGGDPSRHRSLVQEAVEQAHAIAFLANVETLTGEASVDYVTAKRVPVIGTDTATPWAYRSPMYFPQTSTGDAASFGVFAGIAQVLVPAGKTKLATVACVESQFCTDSDRVFATTAKELGFEPVYRARTSLAQPDFTAECLNARNAGAQTFLVFLDSNSTSRLAAACARQGFRPTFATASGLIQDRFKDDPNLAGAVAGTNVFPSFQSGTPATDEYRQAWKTFTGGRPVGEGPPLGWTAGKVLQRAAADIGEPPTSEAILRGLWSIRDDTLGGLAAPLTFVPDQPIKPRPCWFTIVVKERTFTSPDGFRQQCRALPGS